MLTSLVSWWLARITELLPAAWRFRAERPRDGIVVQSDENDAITVSIRHGGRQRPITLGAAARLASRLPVFLRPPATAVLVKHHSVPTAPRRQLGQMLYHELARITPFPAAELFWRWDGDGGSRDGSRANVILTMVPRIAVAPVLAGLEADGLTPNFIEACPARRPCLLPIGNRRGGGFRTTLVRGLACVCAGLAVACVLLPVVLRVVELQRTDAAIAEMKPTIDRVEALRRSIAAGDAGRDVMAQEFERTGDTMGILATVTRLLPDDTFLTDFSLRQRQMTMSGRSASAPRLITSLSAAPEIRNAAFAAPVTRVEGATSDMFSIKADIVR